MPDPKRVRTGSELSDEEISARRSRLDEVFGPRAVPFWLNTPGDYAVGTVEDVSEFVSDLGTVPQITFTFEEGASADTEGELLKGSTYILRLFYKASQGRTLSVGDRFAIGNYGKVANRKGTFEYNDVVLKILS